MLAVSATNPVILIDGRSGAGKTSIAGDVVDLWPLSGQVQSIAMDCIYPGWDGLEAGAEIARERILIPHARGVIGTWNRWDWESAAPAESHAVDPGLPLILEGAGVLTEATARVSDISVWIDSPAESRKKRALVRDGDTYSPHWSRWAAQEERHIARHDPQRHASLRVFMP